MTARGNGLVFFMRVVGYMTARAQMWFPSTYIDVEEARGIFNQPYNSVELNVKVGDLIQFLGEALGWAECLDGEWRYGWVPYDKLSPV